MATRKTIKSATMDNQQVTPAGDASIPTVNNSWEPIDNLDGSHDFKYNPEKESTTIPVALNDETRKLVSRISQITGWTTTVYFRDNTTVQISNCALVSVPALDGDGAVDLELHGKVTWL